MGHQCDATCITWIEAAPWGPALMTGGGDGKVVSWSLAGAEEDYAFWHPQFVDSDDTAPNIAPLANATGLDGYAAPSVDAPITGDLSAVFEPTWGLRTDNP